MTHKHEGSELYLPPTRLRSHPQDITALRPGRPAKDAVKRVSVCLSVIK